jgi:hypothetical protein
MGASPKLIPLGYAFSDISVEMPKRSINFTDAMCKPWLGRWHREETRVSLTSTQVGAIGENLLVNAVMKATDGRMSPFQPLADDDGLDVLFFDKLTGNSVAIQLKCRTRTLINRRTGKRGNRVHFQVRQATFNEARRAYLVAGLINPELTEFIVTWFIPMEHLPRIGLDIDGKWVIRPSKSASSTDRFFEYRCDTINELARRIVRACDANAGDSVLITKDATEEEDAPSLA